MWTSAISYLHTLMLTFLSWTLLYLCFSKQHLISVHFCIISDFHILSVKKQKQNYPPDSDVRAQTGSERAVFNMACLSASASGTSGSTMFSLARQTKHRSCICFLFVLVCLTPLPVPAKRDSLKEVTDGNWEEILTGEWMIELSVSC